MVLFVFAVVTVSIPGLPEWTHSGAYALSTLAGGIFVFILAGTFLPTLTLRLAKIPLGFLPSKIATVLEKFITDFIGGASVLKSPLNLLAIIFLTACVWGSCIMVFHLFMSVLSIEASPWLSVSLTVFVALAVAAPSAPGFLGVFQIACIAAFSLFGISNERATAYSLLSHIHQFAIFISYGLYVLFSYGLTLSELRSENK